MSEQLDVSEIPPLRLRPYLDPKPWGGFKLAALGLAVLPDQRIGEALATASAAIVADGPFAERSLGAVVTASPFAMCGPLGLAVTGGRSLFPLLIKLIDAADDLSIQVHPPDSQAPPGHLGKTEVYHVLEAEPGARIALGLAPGVSAELFAAACRAGDSTTELLRWLPARSLETILIPAGTIHALGAGCFIYEAQQPSDVTYRVDDWHRRNGAGHRRPLHVEPALAVFDPSSRPSPIPPLALPSLAGRRLLVAACRHFALERIELAAGESVTITAFGGPQAVTCLNGAMTLRARGGEISLTAAETGILAAGTGTGWLHTSAETVALRAWVPDLLREIVTPAREAGYADAAIAALAGPLPDITLVMAT